MGERSERVYLLLLWPLREAPVRYGRRNIAWYLPQRMPWARLSTSFP